MIILVFIDDESNFTGTFGTFMFEGGRTKSRIITHKSSNHIGTSFGVLFIKFRIFTPRTRLMEGDVAVIRL